MYHAAPGVPEQNSLEWVELFNRGTNAINLNGWHISKGVKFALPNVTIPAGGYLVISANTNAFSARYPGVGNVIGNWLGVLSNNGDTLELERPDGTVEDTVSYASEGDWAIRQRGPFDLGHFGWEWFTEADGLGKSLELRNPDMPNKYGQNWRDSAAAGGTPGAANSVRTNDIAPLIEEVAHFPAIPKSTNSVLITATVLDELPSGFTVTLFYRTDANPQNNPFLAVPMFDAGTNGDGLAGDGVYGALLPQRPGLRLPGRIIRPCPKPTAILPKPSTRSTR